MSAHCTTVARTPPRAACPLLRELALAGWPLLPASLWLAAGTIAWRALEGQWSRLPLASAAVLAMLLIAWAAAARGIMLLAAAVWLPRWAIYWCVAAPILLTAAALASGGFAMAVVCGLWLPVAVSEALWMVIILRPTVLRRYLPAAGGSAWERLAAHALRSLPPARDPRPAPADRSLGMDGGEHQPLDADVLQQLTRRQTTEGNDRLQGLLRVKFAAGQRTASVHVAFCPPFARLPELKCEPIAGPDARIKLIQQLVHGARWDVKLSREAQQPVDVLLEFSAEERRERLPATGRRQQEE